MKWLVWFVLISCNRHDATPPPSQPPGLEVVSAGVLPRTTLHYALAKATKTQLAIDVGSQIDAGDIHSVSPALHVALEVSVDDVLPDGRMKLRSTITEITATGDDPIAVHAAAEGKPLEKLAITATLAPDGELADVVAPTLPLPPSAQATLAQLVAGFQQLALALPATPVGIGAVWRSTKALAPTNGLALTSVTSVSLVGHAGSTLVLVVSSELRGADQTVAQDGVSVDVRAIGGTSTGKGTVDLARFAVELGQTAALHMDMTTGSDRTPMTMTQTLRVSSK